MNRPHVKWKKNVISVEFFVLHKNGDKAENSFAGRTRITYFFSKYLRRISLFS